jgi:hypothetical protein
MKILILGLLVIGSTSTFSQEIRRTVEQISRECSPAYYRPLKIGKMRTCEVELLAKTSLDNPIICTGETSNKSLCRITLVDGLLKSTCRTKSHDLWSHSSGNAKVNYFQPSFTITGTKKKITVARGNATVISAESDDLSLIIFYETIVIDNEFKSNAAISMKETVLRDKTLSNVNCYLLD